MTSIGELEALSTLDATARYLQALDSRWLLRTKRIESGCAIPNASALPAPVHQTLAATLGSDSVAYVLHDEGMAEMSPELEMVLDPMAMRLRLGPQGWRVVPSRSALVRMNSVVTSVSRLDDEKTLMRSGGLISHRELVGWRPNA